MQNLKAISLFFIESPLYTVLLILKAKMQLYIEANLHPNLKMNL